ncbi:MAG: CotH kinase family protein [Clostridia bacterium]|nr:CotH kinase family protein [Clostridia bacterium]
MKKVFLTIAALFMLASSTSAAVVINEVSASGDWIELYNNATSDVNLGGYFLSDDISEPYLWCLPSVLLGDGDMLIIETNGENKTVLGQALSSNFKISSGEELVLIKPDRETVADYVKLPYLPDGYAYAREKDGRQQWTITSEPTKGMTRSGIECVKYTVSEVAFDESAAFRITYVCSSESTMLDRDSDAEDYIVITNNGADASLAGWYLTDSAENLRLWQFPDVKLLAGASVTVFASGKNHVTGELHTNFKISGGESVILSSPSGQKRGEWVASETVKDAPKFSHEGGFYTSDFFLTLTSDTNSAIYYTTDGSVPDAVNNTAATMLYTAPIKISKPALGDVFALIPSNPSFEIKQQFSEYRRESRGYLQPYANGNKCMVIRASTNGNVVTKTYFVDPLGSARYSLPVLSLSSDPAGLFSDERGILVPGTSGTPNYAQTSDSWERVVNAEMYSTDGKVLFNEIVGAKTHGGGGRHSTQKSLRLNPRSKYGSAKIENTFLETAAKNYGKLLMRNGGQGPNHMGFDDICGTFMKAAGATSQSYEHCIVFIDGEYWGIYSLKETADADALEANYHLPKEMFCVLETSGGVVDGHSSDSKYFKELVVYAQQNDMNLEEHYRYISERVDLDDLATHFIVQSYMANTDWPHGNIKYWRLRTETPIVIDDSVYDGRWRWMLYDADCTFGSRYDATAAQSSFSYDALNNSINSNNPSSNLLKAMLTSDKYKAYFKQRIEDLMQGVLSPVEMEKVINDMDNKLKGEMYEHVVRWRYPAMATSLAERAAEIPSTSKWDANIAMMRSFAQSRPQIYLSHMERVFGKTVQTGALWVIWDDDMGSVYTTEQLTGGDCVRMYGVGDAVFLRAKPRDGFRFVKWSGAYGDVYSDKITITMKTALTMRAEFEPL